MLFSAEVTYLTLISADLLRVPLSARVCKEGFSLTEWLAGVSHTEIRIAVSSEEHG